MIDAASSARRRIRIDICPGVRLRYDLIDDIETFQFAGGQLQLRRDLRRPRGVAVEDRRGPLGSDHRVDRPVQHQHPVGDRQGERAAAAPLTDHRGDDRGAQRAHASQRPRQLGCQSTLLRLDAGVRAWRVDQGDKRQTQAFRHLHDPARLAVPLRVRATVVPPLSVFEMTSFQGNDGDGFAIECADPGDDCWIVS